MSEPGRVMRAIGKLGCALLGAGLLAWAGVTLGGALVPAEPSDALAMRMDDVEMDAGDALAVAVDVDARAATLETRVHRLEARTDAIEAAEAAKAAAAAVVPLKRAPKPTRAPAKQPAALPPASSHWRF